ncbi:MAG TPA: TlpA disulfide reductase family protein [Bryobacteraceae bacterium]|nr:TlpA disulfide reductase family protein [Bryobacteraceae bacterium]
MDNNSDPKTTEWVDERITRLRSDSNWEPDTAQALARWRRQRARMPVRKWALAVLAVAMVCTGVLAFPGPRVFASRCVDACESLFLKPSVIPASLQPAPDFALTDATGATLRLSEYKGKVVLLNFWATWCVPCGKEIPWFMEFEQAHKDQGFAVIGISMDGDGWKSVRPYLDAHKVNYRVAVDDGTVAAKFGGVDSLPETLLIARDGRIVARHVGLVSKSAYESEIAALLR